MSEIVDLVRSAGHKVMKGSSIDVMIGVLRRMNMTEHRMRGRNITQYTYLALAHLKGCCSLLCFERKGAALAVDGR